MRISDCSSVLCSSDLRHAFMPFLIATPIMFTLGSCFVYFVITPMMLRFFSGFEAPGGPDSIPIQMETRVSEYLSLVMTLIFAFGIAFELPVLLTRSEEQPSELQSLMRNSYAVFCLQKTKIHNKS